MAKILFIAHHFPPMGGAGAQRSMQFVKHMPGLGYHPVVLTITQKDIEEGPYQVDESLLEDIPSTVEIYRVKTGEPRKLRKFLLKTKLFRLFWFFLYPVFWELSALWPFKAFSKARKIIAEHGIEIIYTSSGPFSPLLLAYRLKKRLNIKWVADIRDPYTDGYMWDFPSKLHWYFSRWMERKTLSEADIMIVNTPEVKKLYLHRGLALEEKIKVITNGF